MTPPPEMNNANNASPQPIAGPAPLVPRPMASYPYAVVHAPQTLTSALSAMSLLKALHRRLGIALTVGLVFAGIVGTATWSLMPPPKITARMQLHVDPLPPKILFGADNQNHDDSFARTQAYIIKDRFVLNAALRDPEVSELSLIKQQSDPVQWLEKEIRVEFPSPEFMLITISGDNPPEQIKIVSAVTKAYVDGYVNRELNQRKVHQEKLQKIYTRIEERMRSKKEMLRKLQEQNGAIGEKGMAVLQQVTLVELQDAKKELADVRRQLRSLRIDMGMKPDWLEQIWPQYVAALNGLPGPGLPINHTLNALLSDELFVSFASPNAPHFAAEREVEELINKDQVIAVDLQRIAQLEAFIENLREKLQPESFKERSVPFQKQLADLRAEVENRRQELRPKYFQKLREQMRFQAQASQSQMRERYKLLKETEKLLVSDVTRLDEESKQIRKNAVDLAGLQEVIERDENVMHLAGDKLHAMEIEEEAPARITLADKEATLYTPDATKRKMMFTGGAAAAALALVLLAFAWFEFQSRKVYSSDEVVQSLGLHIVGTVPDHSPRSWVPWSRPDDNVYTQSLLTESVDSARTMLLHMASKEKLQIVMITSALAGEGKTSLASHLAASLARAGRRTLLLDSDLRNPTLHRLFDLSRAPGLSELLRGENELESVIRETQIPNLSMISAGKADAVALQALALDGIPTLFEKLRLRYDFIVVDSCPVLPVADAMLVGQNVDAVIFSLLRDVSRLPRVQAAYQRLAMLGIRMLGAVVNGTQHDRYPADYHYIAQD
jgi:succinoglycan biosynthesis transport protein ExoP